MWDYQSELKPKQKATSDSELREEVRGSLSREDHSRRGTARRMDGTGDTTTVRLAKVLSLRAAVAMGEYFVSVDELADKMLRQAGRRRIAAPQTYSV